MISGQYTTKSKDVYDILPNKIMFFQKLAAYFDCFQNEQETHLFKRKKRYRLIFIADPKNKKILFIL